MGQIHWAANLSMLWRDRPFLERFAAAREAGFDTVEFWWHADVRSEDVEAAVKRHGFAVSALNMNAGDLDAGDRGFLNRREFHPSVLTAADEGIALARAVGSPIMNVPVGKDSGEDRDRQAEAILDVLGEIAARAAAAGVLITLEPLNSFDHPTYLLCSSALAKQWIERTGPGVGLLYDAYHLGAMGEDITAAPTLRPAHIQLADWPGRHEPGTGRLPLAKMFDAIEASGYTGHVGLEYAPLSTTDESLRWLRAR